MAELADALDLGSSALGRGSSSLPRRTTIPLLKHALSCTVHLSKEAVYGLGSQCIPDKKPGDIN